jgi:hypothetical protein
MHFWSLINFLLQLCIDVGVYGICSVSLFLSQPEVIQANRSLSYFLSAETVQTRNSVVRRVVRKTVLAKFKETSEQICGIPSHT